MSGLSRGRTGHTTGCGTRPHPGRTFTPNEKYAALVEAAGYVPVALSAEDYIELLPAAGGRSTPTAIKVSHRTYDSEELNPFRAAALRCHGQAEPVGDPPRPLRRVPDLGPRPLGRRLDHRVLEAPVHRPAAPFGELAWDHAPAAGRHGSPAEEEIARGRRRPAPPCHQGRRPAGNRHAKARDPPRARGSQPGPRPRDRCPPPAAAAPPGRGRKPEPGSGRRTSRGEPEDSGSSPR